MPAMTDNAHALESLLVATGVAFLVVRHLQQSSYAYPLTALLFSREDLGAQIEHRERAWNLYGFADFEDGKVPVEDT